MNEPRLDLSRLGSTNSPGIPNFCGDIPTQG
jgi:hypothetical protein